MTDTRNTEIKLQMIVEGLEKMEAENRGLKRVGTMLLIALCAGILLGQAPQRRRFPVERTDTEMKTASPKRIIPASLESKKFVLVHKSGNERASLITDEAGSVLLILVDAKARTRASLSVGDLGPSLSLYDAEGNTRAVVGSTSLVPSHVAAAGGNIERWPASSLLLLSQEAKVLWRSP